MTIIDLALVANSSAIVRDNLCTAAYGDLTNYGTGYIFGITCWDNVNFGTNAWGYADSQSSNEGGITLDVRGENQDTIRLRTATVSAGFGHQCFIKSITLYAGTSVSKSPAAHKLDAITYSTSGTDGSLVTAQGHDDYWEMDITSQTKAQYRIVFSLANSDAQILGGFASYLYISSPGKSRYSID